MPDAHGFDHLVEWGNVWHRCVECGWPPMRAILAESDRRAHHQAHERDRRRSAEQRRRQALASARRAKRLIDRENRVAYGGSS